MKTLTIISEVFIKEDGAETVDRSFNRIIDEYSKYFERINVIGPGKKNFEFIQGSNDKIFFTSTTIYAKPIKQRIKYYLNIIKVKRYFKTIITKGQTDIVQIRIPSLFSMLAFSVVQDLKIPLTVYIAGEWYSSFVSNYNFIGNTIIAKLLDNYQKKIIKNSFSVSAGKEIANIYKKLNNDIYPYFSTTHNKIVIVDKNNKIPQLLYVGRLEKLKRVTDAIIATKILKDNDIEVFLNIVGNGIEKNNLLNLVKRLQLEKNIKFHGHISDTEQLEKLYKQADIFVFPSISEGTPKVLAEAMSFGAIPIAVKDTGSIRFIIENSKNGFLVDAYSPDQIASKIKKIIKSKDLQKTMQKHCYNYARIHTLTKEVENMWTYVFSELKRKKNKICFINISLAGGGAERVISTLANYLVQNYEIHIILLENHDIVYQLNNKIQVHILKTSFLMKSFGKILFIPLQAIELNILLKRYNIEKAISFLVRTNLVFSFTKLFSKRKVIISERSFSKMHYNTANLKNYIMNNLIKFLYKQADFIVAISEGIKKSLIYDYSLNEENIYTIYNPQDINYIKNYQPRDIKFKFYNNIQYFITIGRLVPLKDHKTMIKAFKKVNDINPNTKLLILGEGPLRKELESLIKSLGLETSVFLIGFVNNPFDYLKRADIFVFSSKFEGFGNVLVEAMASGLPVISTNCPSGPSEILNNGEYGILTTVGDINELSEAMLSMLKKQNISKFKEKSLTRAKDFDVSLISKKYLNVLEGKS